MVLEIVFASVRYCQKAPVTNQAIQDSEKNACTSCVIHTK